ncbi:MAG TPA: hypothetical protein VG709_02320 [Actinomycetota bacterium]|nr:hypothetical protein [Actinomycetota bacterium]
MSEQQLYRLGAISGIVGGVLALVFNLLHPRLGDFSDPVSEDLRVAAQSDAWTLIHVGVTAGVLLLIAALYVVARSLREDGAGYRLGRLALGSLVISAPVGLVTLAIDGYATKYVADLVAGGGPLAAGQAVAAIGWAVFMFFVIMLLGVTPALFGAAIAASDDYPAVLGWPAVVLGFGSIVAGLIGYFGGPSAGFFLVFMITSGLLTVWVIALGVVLWRRSADVPDRAATPVRPTA